MMTCRHHQAVEWKGGVEVKFLLQCFLMGHLMPFLIAQLAESVRKLQQ